MMKLLTELRRSDHRISREWHASLYGAGPLQQEVADISFSKFTGKGASCLSRSSIDNDLRHLHQATTAINEFANKRIAHLADEDVATPKLRELHEAVDAVERVYIKYQTLPTADGLGEVLPTILCDWKAIFRRPWIPDEGS